jgi:hypothetical protein
MEERGGGQRVFRTSNVGPKPFSKFTKQNFSNNSLSTNNYQPMQCNAIQKTQQSFNNKQLRKKVYKLLSSKSLLLALTFFFFLTHKVFKQK